MKSIGEQVREFRLRQVPPWNTSDMARAIGGSVRRQHIEQLEANPGRVPRYVVKLAKVMRVSVDALIGAAPTVPKSVPGYTAEAMRLAAWFDMLTEERARFLAYAGATQAIAEQMPRNGPPPTVEHKQSAPGKTKREAPQGQNTRG